MILPMSDGKERSLLPIVHAAPKALLAVESSFSRTTFPVESPIPYVCLPRFNFRINPQVSRIPINLRSSVMAHFESQPSSCVDTFE